MPDPATVARWLRKAVTSSPAATVGAIRHRVAVSTATRRGRIRDADGETYLRLDEAPAALARYVSAPPATELGARAGWLGRLADDAIAHRFDLLGSGPTVVAHGMECRGFEGIRYPQPPPIKVDRAGAWLANHVSPANAPEAARIWQLVDEGYVPIDWQLDFKSGWRWSERTWHRDIEFGREPGADVKVPWELARMQHLPRLAMAGAARHAREFRNQVLDFIAANPPRFGVNWATTMDVAIRAANWLVAYDLFRALGTSFDEDFDVVFRRSILEHGRHIAGNLEWSEARGNHYLADVAGLGFVGAYLPETPETTQWRGVASRELISEIRGQFHAEGSNVEGSTSYHRLSAETAAYAAAILLRLGGPMSIPSDVGSRLAGMADFVVNVTKPDGRVPQIGDNDSGRFIDLGPIDDRGSDDLDHRSVVGAVNGLVHRPDLASFARGAELEGWLVAALAGGSQNDAASPKPTTQIGSEADLEATEDWIALRPDGQRRSWRIGLPQGALADAIRQLAYPAFGLYVFRGPRLYVAVRCGTLASGVPTGHAHNDQLSIELQVDREDWTRDPGTYVYTPAQQLRNDYRSMHAHFGPRFQTREPARLDAGLFELTPTVISRCTYWGPRGFAGWMSTSDGRVVRAQVQVVADAVEVDWAAEGDALAGGELGSGEWRAYRTNLPFSPGYGRRESPTAA